MITKHPTWVFKYTEPRGDENYSIGTRIMILTESNYGELATIVGFHYTAFAIPGISYHIMPDKGLASNDSYVVWGGEFKEIT